MRPVDRIRTDSPGFVLYYRVVGHKQRLVVARHYGYGVSIVKLVCSQLIGTCPYRYDETKYLTPSGGEQVRSEHGKTLQTRGRTPAMLNGREKISSSPMTVRSSGLATIL